MALWKKEDTADGAPKYLNAEDAAKAVFVDANEATVAGNRAKGLKTPGWSLYSNAGGRNRAEILVAMSGAGTAASIAIGDDGVTGNTDIEDTIVEDEV